MGSYACVGPAAGALLRKVPVVLHEANVIPGRAVRMLSAWASAVAVSFEETRFHLRRKNLVLTGMPLRSRLRQPSPPPEDLSRDRFTLLVVGGSRGAHALNEAVTQAVTAVAQGGRDLQVAHLTGSTDETPVRDAYRRAGLHASVAAFTHEIGALYRAADLAICRAGAATCAELLAFRLPSLLVPYPYATRDHQMANARALERLGAADVVPERDLSVSWLTDYLEQALRDLDKLARMSTAAASQSPEDATGALAELVESAGRGKRA
jgi:UDP-N-acetylglucosamine--N-acetylmuramyl-(pentapeptide) pyrophosphoryl-undecaprenol N-acetylglucosamine transferase